MPFNLRGGVRRIRNAASGRVLLRSAVDRTVIAGRNLGAVPVWERAGLS